MIHIVRFKKLLGSKNFIFTLLVSVVALIFFFVSSLSTVMTYRKKTVEKNSATIRVAFDRLNDIIRLSEGIVTENSSFFQDEQAFNRHDEEFVRIVNSVKRMRSFCPFVEEVVIYKKDSPQMITTEGSISRSAFFEYGYEVDELTNEYWDSIMKMYNTPTIIPVNNYTVLSYPATIKKLFVVPKMFNLYNTGVLIFVNEQLFWDYCDLSEAGSQGKIALYDGKGNLAISNTQDSKSKIDPSLSKSMTRGKINLFGQYQQISLLDYEDLILYYRVDNPIIPVTTSLLVLTVLLLVICVVYFRIKQDKPAGKRDYESGVKLAELLISGINEKSIEAAQGTLLEIRGLVTRLGEHSAICDDDKSQYWYKDTTSLKMTIRNRIVTHDITGLCDEIKTDVEKRIREGINLDMLTYHLFDFYMTLVNSLKDGKVFFEDTYRFVSEGIKKCYLAADMEKMVNLFINIFRDVRNYTNSETSSKVSDITSYINNNYSDGLYLDIVADQFGMTPKYFSEFFKKNVGIGFVEYLTKLRLEKATELLINSELSIKAISEKIGYATSSAFVTAFKKYYGTTPNEFRNNKK